jgi:beta-glucanase (GH16 family)
MKANAAIGGMALLLLIGSAAAAQGGRGGGTMGADDGIGANKGWTLAWSDEFDSRGIDPANWNFDSGAGGWGNREFQFYTDRPENARIEDGCLVIEARVEKYQGSYYTSARLKTKGLRGFRYGRIEARIKVPAGKGLWPAFWMLGEDIDAKGWPACGEIDVMEYIGREPNLVLGTLHGPGYSGDRGLSKRLLLESPVAQDFHVFAVEWDESGIAWFCDGVEYSRIARGGQGSNEWVFDGPFFIILNLAVGGNLPGPIAIDTPFPARCSVDYVRVYRRGG